MKMITKSTIFVLCLINGFVSSKNESDWILRKSKKLEGQESSKSYVSDFVHDRVVEDFGLFLDSKSDTPTVVVDISTVSSGYRRENDTFLDYYDEEDEEDEKAVDQEATKITRDASYAYKNYQYYNPQLKTGWHPVVNPQPIILPVAVPVTPHPLTTTETDDSSHYSINYHEDQSDSPKHTFFVDEVVPPSGTDFVQPVLPPPEPELHHLAHHHHGHHFDPYHPSHVPPFIPSLSHPHYDSIHGQGTKKPEQDLPRTYFPSPSIPGILVDEGATKLLELLEDVDLKSKVSGTGPFTLFAPTNNAFKRLDPNFLNILVEDKELLKSVLEYHIVTRKLYSRNFVNDLVLSTQLEGHQLRIGKEDCGGAYVNGVEIAIKSQDQTASNGVVHFIDDVIYPIPEGSLAFILSKDKRFGAFADALTEVGLEGRFNSTDSFTMFIPTNDAFDKLSKTTLEMLAEDREAMASLINKHTVNGIKLTPSFGQGDFTTLGKSNIKARIRKGKLSINDKVQVIEGDIICTNGVIHVIDEVLL